MLVFPFSLFLFLAMLKIGFTSSACDIRVFTINFECHLEWNCPDSNPKTKFTVSAKSKSSWSEVQGCIQITRQHCNLSQAFPNLHGFNFIELKSEQLTLLNRTICDPIKGANATFSAPSVSLFLENETVWVMVQFPCAPPISCRSKDEEIKPQDGCICPLNHFKSISATVTLFNKHNVSEIQIDTVSVEPFEVQFGLLSPGQVYCAQANFSVEGFNSSPTSLQQCIQLPRNTGSLITIIVSAVLLSVGIMALLLWRQCSSSGGPPPRSLALLGKKLTSDSFRLEPESEILEGDHVSVVSLCALTLLDNQSAVQISTSPGNGYYACPFLLMDPVLETEDSPGEDQLPLFPPPSIPPGHMYQNQVKETQNIPLSSVRVKSTAGEDYEGLQKSEAEVFNTD